MKTTVIGILVTLCCFLLVSCGVDSISKLHEVEFDYETFSGERDRWVLSETEHYQYILYSSGFVPIQTLITVEGGQFKSQTGLLSDTLNPHWSESGSYLTINEIYEIIEAQFRLYQGVEVSEDDFYYTRIEVEYDKVNHIPVKIKYVTHIPTSLAVDGNFYYEVREFHKLYETTEPAPTFSIH
ncbi:MAG: DUF6174 domain-containing protein [Tannerellaceae bacterium]|jgi:hypothetical protein|nr:DUF6174 domain-containing protein [Tannerellaceae bacterium]